MANHIQVAGGVTPDHRPILFVSIAENDSEFRFALNTSDVPGLVQALQVQAAAADEASKASLAQEQAQPNLPSQSPESLNG
jgi:hypothetical protein